MPQDTKPLDHIAHDETRANIPTAELEPVLHEDDRKPIRVAYDRRNPDLDPQLVWRGKDMDLDRITVDAPPIYLQEQVHPKALIEDLRAGKAKADDLFAHFGLVEEDLEAEVEFYRHSRKWSNRMILGDSLQVMASLAEREGLKGQVQMIYIDPPYGIKFNSNFQWSTTSRDVKDGNLDHLTREPEQVKAFRDTWRDGIHSYLGYLRDRLIVARELLTESGSCFVQIGDENVHRVRAIMDEVFGSRNFVSEIVVQKTGDQPSGFLPNVNDALLWYAFDIEKLKYRQLYKSKSDVATADRDYKKSDDQGRRFRVTMLTSSRPPGSFPVTHDGERFGPGRRFWTTGEVGFERLRKSDRIRKSGNQIYYLRYLEDFSILRMNNVWTDTVTAGFHSDKTYVVQTGDRVVQRCVLMTTDPGDLVLDPTCGSGTTAYVAEQWGRRWITIDTSRVALALARARVMGAKYPYYLLEDSKGGADRKAREGFGNPSEGPFHEDIRAGFVYERVARIMLKSIANNTEIDVIWDRLQPAVEDARARLNAALKGHPTPFEVTTGGRVGKTIDFTASGEVTMPSGEPAPAGGFMEWEIPREAPSGWPEAAKAALDAFWSARIGRQRKIDEAIERKGREDDYEILYDKPYEDRNRIRVAGPFTVESLSPHRSAAVDEHGELIEESDAAKGLRTPEAREAENFRTAIMENLKKAGVHQAGKEDAIRFESLTPWPGEWIAAEGRYMEGETERRAGIFIGPEYGTVARADLVACAREAADAGFDLVIACAFNFDAHAQEFQKLGRIPILQARMNPDLHMAGDLKAGGGNLFVVFGEPDIEILKEGDRYRVKLLGVDIFKPAKGVVESSEADEIACWFIDTDYSGESFFVRQAYFPGADIPYKQLQATLKGDIDEEAWESLKKTVSRPFPRPKSGRIAVKVINHLGDEVMKVFGV
jgi:adenine-specific DNA-methyltransferase